MKLNIYFIIDYFFDGYKSNTIYSYQYAGRDSLILCQDDSSC